MFHVFAALAVFERDLVVEQTQAGLAAARARGRTGGRPTVHTPAKLKQAQRMMKAGDTMTEIAEALGVSRSTLYRRLRSATSGRELTNPVASGRRP